jgi:hypothetical protein
MPRRATLQLEVHSPGDPIGVLYPFVLYVTKYFRSLNYSRSQLIPGLCWHGWTLGGDRQRGG